MDRREALATDPVEGNVEEIAREMADPGWRLSARPRSTRLRIDCLRRFNV